MLYTNFPTGILPQTDVEVVMDILIAVFPCSSIEPVDVTVAGELGGFLEADDLGEIFLLLGVKMGCSILDFILGGWMIMPKWPRVKLSVLSDAV